MTDDYGDGAVSLNFYKGEITDIQKKIAKRTRSLVEARVGRYTGLKALVGTTNTNTKLIKRAGNLVTRALDLRWVQGNSDVAETSFFKINSQGTPLDAIEEMLLRYRHRAIAIASRSILRAGTGHKYWSRYSKEKQTAIEVMAEEFHNILFDPEFESPITTIDLPLGGSVSPINALALLIDFLAISSSRTTAPRNITTDPPDEDGSDTLEVLARAKEIAGRLTGKQAASLGLHPAVYFYNERGIHSRHLFLGVARLITDKIRNNDTNFFKNFTAVRARLEKYLIENKPLITQMLANVNRDARVLRVRDMLDTLVKTFAEKDEFTTEDLLASIGFAGRVLDVKAVDIRGKISDDIKSAVLLKQSLSQAPKCPICGGLLHTSKSASYDHVQRIRDGGNSSVENLQITHPYCNSGIKN
jgi:hypothetical protein